jgi:hypothetical protein
VKPRGPGGLMLGLRLSEGLGHAFCAGPDDLSGWARSSSGFPAPCRGCSENRVYFAGPSQVRCRLEQLPPSATTAAASPRGRTPHGSCWALRSAKRSLVSVTAIALCTLRTHAVVQASALTRPQPLPRTPKDVSAANAPGFVLVLALPRGGVPVDDDPVDPSGNRSVTSCTGGPCVA